MVIITDDVLTDPCIQSVSEEILAHLNKEKVLTPDSKGFVSTVLFLH